MTSLLGIDNGLTVTKAVIFDADGTVLSVARHRVPQLMPQPRFVEREMTELWTATAQAIREAIELSGRDARDIKAVAATAHGDGLYLLDVDKQPLGPGILSLDSRAGDIAKAWNERSTGSDALALTGQMPHASAPSALLAWVQQYQPERFAKIAHILSCKDWLRFCLSGTIGTDRTEASTAFTDVASQDYSEQALELFELEMLWDALPPMANSAEIVGTVTPEAAALTGLVQDTPVAAGLHDVTASALGIGGQRQGTVDIVAGTYSINQIVSSKPERDERWFCRNAIEPGQWNSMAISPASTANYDWFLETLCKSEAGKADVHALLANEIDEALARPSTVLFHPYLFGSPHGPVASAGFLGLRGWHERGDMLRAVLEGIAFNHRDHVDALRDGFPFEQARLTGGASRNPAFVQMFADILAMPVTVTQTEEAAAWGTALCAGMACGLYASPHDDPRDLTSIEKRFEPDEKRSAAYETRYQLWRGIAASMSEHWPAIDALGDAQP